MAWRWTAITPLGLALALAPWAATSTDDTTSPPPPQSSVDAGELQRAVDAFVAGHDGGASVLVVREGTASAATAGVANSLGDPITDTTAFRVGSLTKAFVATVVLQLVDEGRVDLDEPLSTYLPDETLGADVSVRDLLRHRSGIPDYVSAPGFLDDALGDLTHAYTPDEVLDYVRELPPGPSDTSYEYSSTNYVLIGQLIERIEDSDLSGVLTQRVFGPLGLEHTVLGSAGVPPPDALASGWYQDVFTGDPATPFDSLASGAWAAGALISTPEDLHTFLAALVGGDLLSDEAWAEMSDPGPDDYGLGLGVLRLPSGRVLLGHDGDIVAYLSVMAIDPDNGDTVIVLTNNAELAPDALAEDLIADW